MYKIRTVYVDLNGEERKMTNYAKTKDEAKWFLKIHNDTTEIYQATLIKQEVYEGKFIKKKEIYNNNLKYDGGH